MLPDSGEAGYRLRWCLFRSRGIWHLATAVRNERGRYEARCGADFALPPLRESQTPPEQSCGKCRRLAVWDPEPDALSNELLHECPV